MCLDIPFFFFLKSSQICRAHQDPMGEHNLSGGTQAGAGEHGACLALPEGESQQQRLSVPGLQAASPVRAESCRPGSSPMTKD